MKKTLPVLALSAAFFTLGQSAASAATITSLADDFEAESPSLNYNSFANWDVTDGTVDSIPSGSYSITCLGSRCVDLDGSTGNSGLFTTKDEFAAGAYSLNFDMSGSQRSGTNSVLVTFGDLSETITLAANAPWQTFSYSVTLATAGYLQFAELGNDNIGLVLDNVYVSQISEVPVPAAVWLFGSALGMFADLRGKKKA